jgi:signal transduction histidine kinase
MLAQLLQELTPRLLGGVADAGARERWRLLSSELVQALSVPPPPAAAAPTPDLDGALGELSAFEGGVYDLLEERAVPVAELRALAAWFRARADQAWRQRGEARLQLLARVSTLADSLDVESVLGKLARLSIPELADWSAVDLVENGVARRGHIAHRDPALTEAAQRLAQYPPDLQGSSAGDQLLAGQSILLPDVGDPDPDDRTRSPERYELILLLGGVSSLMSVPIVVLGRVIGLLTFLLQRGSSRRYDGRDLALAEELARRAGQILENARLHEQLRHSEGRFRVSLAHSHTSVFELDVDLRVRWIYNSQLSSDGAGVLGRNVHELFPRASALRLEALEKSVLADGQRRSITVDALAGGERRHLLVHYDPLYDATGAIVGLTGSSVDMTEAKRIQDELAQALGFREQMMGVLGHDLRNPVSAVRGLAQLLLLKPVAPDKLHEALRRIDQSGKRMDEMIGTLLDFTRSRFHGSLPIAREEVDLDDICRGVADELRAAHPGRSIEVATDGDCRGRLDAARMAQVVSNLVANALHHGDAGAPVTLQLDGDGEDGALVLAVGNRGPAIPPALIDTIFEPFRQGRAGEGADDSGGGELTRRAGGLGLGLYIVRQIVHAHGGTVTVRSNDEATSFTVRLPRNTD